MSDLSNEPDYEATRRAVRIGADVAGRMAGPELDRLRAIEVAARGARSALALTYTNVPEGARPHWCRYLGGHHDATCSGMLMIQDALRKALDESPL